MAIRLIRAIHLGLQRCTSLSRSMYLSTTSLAMIFMLRICEWIRVDGNGTKLQLPRFTFTVPCYRYVYYCSLVLIEVNEVYIRIFLMQTTCKRRDRPHEPPEEQIHVVIYFYALLSLEKYGVSNHGAHIYTLYM
jgi:hypothetical protein